MTIARAARAPARAGSRVVSALGADARSRVFYNRVKGEMEAAVGALGYERCVIARPSLLLGDRAALGQPTRRGEVWAARLLGPMLRLVPARRPADRGRHGGAALVAALEQARPGARVLSSADLQRLGGARNRRRAFLVGAPDIASRGMNASPLHPHAPPHMRLGVIRPPYDRRAIGSGRSEGTPMRSLALALAVFVAAAASFPGNADARRIGGGGAIGMQRSLPARPPAALPARPAAPVAQPAPAPTAAAAAATPRRSWLGPIAGLAAGIGLAALMSHLGFGAAFGNLVTLLLLGVSPSSRFDSDAPLRARPARIGARTRRRRAGGLGSGAGAAANASSAAGLADARGPPQRQRPGCRPASTRRPSSGSPS